MRWFESLKAVGQAYLELLRSEVDALRDDLAATGRRVGGLLLLLVAAGFTLFWALGALVYLLIEVLALWLPRWGAALVVLLVLIAIVVILVLVVRRRWSRTELPARTVQRRLDEHLAWWESKVLESPDLESPDTETASLSGDAEPVSDRREMEP